jgi:transaldolase
VPAELGEAVGLGATGGTSNPVIVYQTVKANPDLCLPPLDKLIADHPHATEDELTWKLIAVLGRESAKKLLPVFEATKGAKGYLSMQVNPKYYTSQEHMVAHATELAALAPNIAIKAPATETGIAAMEEMTARGIRINATVSFSVAQALAMSAALTRGLKRAQAAGLNADAIRPYITLMIGRVDDQLKRVVEKDKLTVTPGIVDWGRHRGLQARPPALQGAWPAGHAARRRLPPRGPLVADHRPRGAADHPLQLVDQVQCRRRRTHAHPRHPG